MHAEHRKVFDFFAWKFPGTDVAIHGSSLRDFATARDIDVAVLAAADYPFMVSRLNTRYSGWNVVRGADGICVPVKRGETPAGPIEHLRRTIYPVILEGISKPIQLGQSDKCRQFADMVHAVLLPSGQLLNGSSFYSKPRR